MVVFEEGMQGGDWTMVHNVVLVKFWLNTRSGETKNLDPYFITLMAPMTPDIPALTTNLHHLPKSKMTIFLELIIERVGKVCVCRMYRLLMVGGR